MAAIVPSDRASGKRPATAACGHLTLTSAAQAESGERRSDDVLTDSTAGITKLTDVLQLCAHSIRGQRNAALETVTGKLETVTGKPQPTGLRRLSGRTIGDQ